MAQTCFAKTALSISFCFLWTRSLALGIQRNGTENFGRFGKKGKKVIPRKVLLFFRKISTGMSRSIWILPRIFGFSIQMYATCSHGVPVLCSSANELQQNSGCSRKKKVFEKTESRSMFWLVRRFRWFFCSTISTGNIFSPFTPIFSLKVCEKYIKNFFKGQNHSPHNLRKNGTNSKINRSTGKLLERDKKFPSAKLNIYWFLKLRELLNTNVT